MWEMRQVMEKRVQVRFSEGLSPEGKLAMKQTMEEHRIEMDSKAQDTSKKTNKDESKSKAHRIITFSDDSRVKDATSRRLHGDDDNNPVTEMDSITTSVGGGKGEIPTINVETEQETRIGEKTDQVLHGDQYSAAIEETAKNNSVEKCLGWMKVNDDSKEKEAVTETSLPVNG